MQKYPLEKVVLIILQSQRGEAFLLHKFALKSELGELIGIATKENKGLSDSVQALNSTIYNISTGNKETALFKVCDYGSNINHILHIYSSPNGTLDSCNYIRVILSDKYIFVNKFI